MPDDTAATWTKTHTEYRVRWLKPDTGVDYDFDDLAEAREWRTRFPEEPGLVESRTVTVLTTTTPWTGVGDV